MVIQENSKSNERNLHNSSSDDSNGSSQFQQPGKLSESSVCSTLNMHNRPAINRQMGVSTLAALHRRFGLPASLSTHGRPSADFRASASKALDILRQTIQAAVTKEIDDVIKKYFEKFFIPAVNNIRTNLGEESVSEDQVRAVCRSMLDATRILYSTTPRAEPSPGPEASDSESSNSTDHCFSKATDSSKRNSMYSKRKESDTDSDTGSMWKNKKVKLEVISDESGPSLRSKWDPQRLKHDTLFIMGSHAHKVLGLGSSRGRLYTKHAGLLRYPADPADKEWMASHNLMSPVGGRTYIMVMEDIKELAASESYRQSALPLAELGFCAPPFMLCKMKSFLEKRNLSDDLSLPSTPKTEHFALLTEIKSEITESPDSNQTQYEELKRKEIAWESESVGQIKYEIQSTNLNKNHYNNSVKTEFSAFHNKGDKHIKVEIQEQDKQRRYNFDFLDNWLPSMASEAGARNAIRHVTGANPDTISLANEEFDLGFSVSVPHLSRPATPNSKCITVESSAGGPVHSVPVARLHAHLGHVAHGLAHRVPEYETSASGGGPVHSASRYVQSQQVLRYPHLTNIPYNKEAGHVGGATLSSGVGSLSQDVSTPSSFSYTPHKQVSAGNLLHNSTVSRNMLNRSLNLVHSTGQAFHPASSSASFSVTLETGTVPRISSTSTNKSIDNTVLGTKQIMETACKSSDLLKKVLRLGRACGKGDDFSVQETSAGVAAEHALACTTPAPTGRGAGDAVARSGRSGRDAQSHLADNATDSGSQSAASVLSAAHATLSALLAAADCKAMRHNPEDKN